MEIVELLANGFSNRDIADHLMITVYTVKDHLKNIYAKIVKTLAC